MMGIRGKSDQVMWKIIKLIDTISKRIKINI